MPIKGQYAEPVGIQPDKNILASAMMYLHTAQCKPLKKHHCWKR